MSLRSKMVVGAMVVPVAVFVFLVAAGAASAETAPESPAVEATSTAQAIGLVSVAAVMIGACVSAGYAVAKVGSAAMGAIAEKPEIMGRALIFVGLAEGIAIYGLIIAIMILRRL